MNPEIKAYNAAQSAADKKICDLLYKEFCTYLPEAEHNPSATLRVTSKIWHGHPVWFINDNPIVGYHKLKNCVRILFWSGQGFDEEGLAPEGSFKAAEARFTDVKDVNTKDLKRWLTKAKKIQWDYKNIVKRKGVLVKL